jgi:hypothetical protein
MTNGALSTNDNLGPRHLNAELSPPPSYDDVVLCNNIFVIDIDDGGEYDVSRRWHDEQLPTYDEATIGNYAIEGKFF